MAAGSLQVESEHAATEVVDSAAMAKAAVMASSVAAEKTVSLTGLVSSTSSMNSVGRKMSSTALTYYCKHASRRNGETVPLAERLSQGFL